MPVSTPSARALSLLALALASAPVIGCAAAPLEGDETTGTDDQELVSDIASMVRRADGLFDVTCRDGRVEQGVSADALRSDRVCALVTPPTSSPFDSAWCAGTTVGREQLLSRFERAATTARLATVTLDARQRECQDQTGCAGWTASREVPLYAVVSGNTYSFTPAANVAVPRQGEALLAVNATALTLSLEVATPTKLRTAWVLPWDLAAGNGTRLGDTLVQVGGWSTGGYSYQSFYERKITGTCLFTTSTGRVYHPDASGKYTEYQVVQYGTFGR